MKGLGQVAAYVSLWLAAVFFTMGLALLPLGLVLFLIFQGAGRRAEKALQSVSSTLMPNEQLVATAIQHRVFGLFSRRAVMAITDSRVLVIQRGLLGGFKMLDIQWKDLKDVTIEQNVLDSFCGSNLQFAHFNRSVAQIVVDGIPSEMASTIYSKAQFQEQAWEEKRRVRAIEETRAAAGGVVVHAPQAQHTAVPVPEPKGNRMLDEIAKAKELLDMGAVSDAEFQEMKAKILANA